MKPQEVQEWALRVVRAVQSGHPYEDALVELKSTWPETPAKAARQIAGLINAARGSSTLWIVGVDEEKGVVGADHNDLADWWSRVCAVFHDQPPYLLDKVIHEGENTFVALLFEPRDLPYLVRNPSFGVQGCRDSVEIEVPWREGTKTRTARRSDLLSLLAPLTRSPHFEYLEGSLYRSPATRAGVPGSSWKLDTQFYVHPRTPDTITIPFHRCGVVFRVDGLTPVLQMDSVSLRPEESSTWRRIDSPATLPNSLSRTIAATSSEVLISGPGKLMLLAQGFTNAHSGTIDRSAFISFSLGLAGVDEVAAKVDIELAFDRMTNDTVVWSRLIPPS